MSALLLSLLLVVAGMVVAPGVSSASTTYSETTGGETHSWSNYTDAGGIAGPVYGGSNTLLIDCVEQNGFAVSDGNRNWYHIDGTSFYASADAFYNNGATSGSLHGTPYVDPAVPSCESLPTTPAGVNETAGAVAHTWTNPANAGGTQGPSISRGQTVLISCKIVGFKVADGNSWWYQLSSTPWNNAFYASADAFYNNGATSGSLTGTPFVDSSVPTCTGAPTGGGSSGGGGSGGGSTGGTGTTPLAMFYSPFVKNAVGKSNCGSWCGLNLNLTDQSVRTTYMNQWFPSYPKGCGDIGAAYQLATPSGYYPAILAGWSLGRVGPEWVLLQAARNDPFGEGILRKINYVLLIDPGPYGDLAPCDKSINAGDIFANWLQLNPSAHLVIISGNLTQQDNSKGIQEIYFNSIRNIAAMNKSNIRNQVLVCNYAVDHYTAYYTGQYWIKHQIGMTASSCPWLSGQGKTWKPTAGWHP